VRLLARNVRVRVVLLWNVRNVMEMDVQHVTVMERCSLNVTNAMDLAG